MTALCAVAPAPAGRADRARAVAASLDLPFVNRIDDAQCPVVLVVADGDAWLVQTGQRVPGPVRVDFADPAMRHRRKGGHNELLGRAVGVRESRKPAVLDATAGLGRDAFVLADLGCEVQLCEQSPILGFLLSEAVAAAAIDAQASVRAAAARMTVRVGDSREANVAPGTVIYLDPMFPERRSSAAVRKDLATLQRLHAGDGGDAEGLLAWALAQHSPRIVVKRPPKSAPLQGMRVSHSIEGKAVRFDVLVRPQFEVEASSHAAE